MKSSLASLDIVPGTFGRIRCGPHWRLDARWSTRLHDYDFWYIWAGRGHMITSDGPLDLHPGRGLWMRPGRHYEAEQDPQDRLGVTFIHFRLKHRNRILDPSEFTPPVEVFDPKSPGYVNTASGHVAELLRDAPASEVPTLLLKTILLEIVSDAKRAQKPGGTASHHREMIDHGIIHIQKDPARHFTVEEIARDSGYSRDHFSRIFHHVTGETPKALIVRQRIERAIVLLRESSQTLSQISETLGYQDLGFFSRQFKQKIGVSPSRFRQNKPTPG